MTKRGLLIAIDSVGIDPLGHQRPDSVYHDSQYLFPKADLDGVVSLPDAPIEGALVATDVTEGHQSGAIECALTYTAHFTGQSAVARHGLMQGLGLKENLLESMVAEANLFTLFEKPCLANSIFPAHLSFLGGSYAEDLVPTFSREDVERGLCMDSKPVRLIGKDKHGLAELFTLAEINQNIFVHAAQQAGVPLRTFDDVRRDEALTSSMTHELENTFDLSFFGEEPLPPRTPEQAAAILVNLVNDHDFVFYKYQIADLVSHSGRIDLARNVFATIEQFVFSVLNKIDPAEAFVVVTSDHGHLEQVNYHDGHPKTNVPTWCFGQDAAERAAGLTKPEAIYHLFAELSGRQHSANVL